MPRPRRCGTAVRSGRGLAPGDILLAGTPDRKSVSIRPRRTRPPVLESTLPCTNRLPGGCNRRRSPPRSRMTSHPSVARRPTDCEPAAKEAPDSDRRSQIRRLLLCQAGWRLPPACVRQQRNPKRRCYRRRPLNRTSWAILGHRRCLSIRKGSRAEAPRSTPPCSSRSASCAAIRAASASRRTKAWIEPSLAAMRLSESRTRSCEVMLPSRSILPASRIDSSARFIALPRRSCGLSLPLRPLP